LALLVDREVHHRNDKRQTRLLRDAKLKYPQACIEDLDTRAGRGLERRAVMSLALGDWIASGHSVLITGATGSGKSWLACALVRRQKGPHSALPKSASLGRGATHSPRQWHVWQVADSIGQDGCVGA
jgi:DNA-binding NtrC family response regulator